MIRRLLSYLHLLTHPLAGALGFGLLIWMLLPNMVVLVDDDFGYLRSVLETCKRGRAWTCEWLTPWAASMSMLAALLFKATGSFNFAIHFSLALAAALSFLGLTLFLTNNGVSRMKAWWIAALALGSPTVLFMLVMFTSVPLYLGCMWMCVYLSQQKRWGWFFVVWFIGLAARQSAVVWLALPAWDVLAHLWETRTFLLRGRSIWAPAAVIAGGGVALLLLKMEMNPTYGQAILATTAKGLNLRGNSLLLSVLALAGGYGWSCFSLLLFSATARTKAVENMRFLWCRVALVPLCAAGFVSAGWFFDHITVTHSTYGDPWAPVWFGLIGITAALGITLHPIFPRWQMLGAGMGATALLSLYGGMHDYYFIDPFFWGFASAVMPISSGKVQTVSIPSLCLRWITIAVMVLCTLWNMRSYIRLKYEMDRVAALNVIYEKCLREGKLKPHEIGMAPFGYVGWRFESYHHTHEGKDSPDLGGFVRCVDGWTGQTGMAVETNLPKQLSRHRSWLPSHNSAFLGKSRDAEILGTLKTRVLWFYSANYLLKHIPTPVRGEGKHTINYADYQDSPFPLNDQEWKTLIATGSFDCSSP